jgi:quercetin dioxygenase-like cupin family protein
MELPMPVNTAEHRLKRTRYYMGGYWTFLATGADTNGQFSLIELNLRGGLEPPAHIHTYEDESFHVLAGELIVSCGDQEQVLKAGDFIHLPKGIRHSFKVNGERAKVLMHIVPAGLENMFQELSQPANELDFPPFPHQPPSAEWLQRLTLLQQQFGITNIDNKKIKTI